MTEHNKTICFTISDEDYTILSNLILTEGITIEVAISRLLREAARDNENQPLNDPLKSSDIAILLATLEAIQNTLSKLEDTIAEIIATSVMGR